MYESLEYLKILNSGNLDIFFRPRHDMHLSATDLCHQRARSHTVGNALDLSLLMHLYYIAQTESLRRLGADELVAWYALGGGETILTLEDSLAAFDACDGIAVSLTGSDIVADDILAEQGTDRVMDEHKVLIITASLLESIDTIMDRLHAGLAARKYPF